MAAATSNEAEKKEDMVCDEADSNQEDSAAGDEEEGPGKGQSKAEENEVVTVGSTYPCKKADGSLHDAEVVKTRMNKQLGVEEYYVHYIGLNRRQNEWVDKTRLVLTKAEVKEDAKDEASGNDQEMADATEQANGNTPQGQKRKLEEQEPEIKKTKVEAAPNSSLVGPAGDFAEELTCHLCVELFKDPVMVECGHNFCKACIEKAWAGQDSFSCPECKEVINDKKYTINRALANLVKKTVTAPVIPAEKREKPLENCPEHDERLKLYCKDDGTLGCIICRDSLKHVSHNFLPILDAVAVYREQLTAIVAPLEASLKVSEQVVSEQNEKIVQHKNNICEYKDHIVAEFERLHEFLEEREKVLLAQLQEQGDGLLKEMEQNMVKMQENIDGIKKTIAVAKDRVDENDSISFLTDIKAFIDKCLEQQQEVVSSSGNTLLSKELCQGTFKGPIQYILWKEIKKAIVPYLSPMLLDPSTAHPNLILSDGLTSVKYGDNKLSVPDNPKRFSQCILVLGSEGFDSGRHYWEVDVGDKTAWDVGMASESSNRKGKIKLNPKNGYWAIWLRNGNAYKALESPSKTLVLASKPHKIGVYVDYEGGMISFYNADDMTPIYTFNATFTEKLYPYLSPFLHDSGRNAEPLRLVHN